MISIQSFRYSTPPKQSMSKQPKPHREWIGMFRLALLFLSLTIASSYLFAWLSHHFFESWWRNTTLLWLAIFIAFLSGSTIVASIFTIQLLADSETKKTPNTTNPPPDAS